MISLLVWLAGCARPLHQCQLCHSTPLGLMGVYSLKTILDSFNTYVDTLLYVYDTNGTDINT